MSCIQDNGDNCCNEISRNDDCPFCRYFGDCSELDAYAYYCDQGDGMCHICDTYNSVYNGSIIEPGVFNKKTKETTAARHVKSIDDSRDLIIGLVEEVDEIIELPPISDIIVSYIYDLIPWSQ